MPPARTRAARVLAALLAGLALLFGPADLVRAQADPARDTAVAETVLGILSYVRWPADPPEVRLCVVGPAERAGALLQAGRIGPATGGKRTVVVRKQAPAGAEDNCDALYLGPLDDSTLSALFQRLSGKPVVTISERREPCTAGGMFCLDARTADIGFEVNLDSIARSGVRVHPSVLQLARRKPAAKP